MGTAETVSKTVDSLLSDWAQIVHLYTVVEELAEYFRIGKYSAVSKWTNEFKFGWESLEDYLLIVISQDVPSLQK